MRRTVLLALWKFLLRGSGYLFLYPITIQCHEAKIHNGNIYLYNCWGRGSQYCHYCEVQSLITCTQTADQCRKVSWKKIKLPAHDDIVLLSFKQHLTAVTKFYDKSPHMIATYVYSVHTKSWVLLNENHCMTRWHYLSAAATYRDQLLVGRCDGIYKATLNGTYYMHVHRLPPDLGQCVTSRWPGL